MHVSKANNVHLPAKLFGLRLYYHVPYTHWCKDIISYFLGQELSIQKFPMHLLNINLALSYTFCGQISYMSLKIWLSRLFTKLDMFHWNRCVTWLMHTKFRMIWAYSDKAMLRTRKPDAADANADKSNPYNYVAFSGDTKNDIKVMCYGTLKMGS